MLRSTIVAPHEVFAVSFGQCGVEDTFVWSHTRTSGMKVRIPKKKPAPPGPRKQPLKRVCLMPVAAETPPEKLSGQSVEP
eukprot:286965-Amphidinium_carterae.1